MNKIIVVTDSNATIPEALRRELDIRVVPILVNFGDHSYRDGVDLTPTEFYRMLRTSEVLPTTSGPSVGDFLNVYNQAAQDGTGVVAIHLPAELSSIYDTAVMASKMVEDVPIRVLDSRSVSMAQGFVVLEAARAAAAGADIDTVVARAEEISQKVHFFFMLDTLEYLRRGGRIGGAAAFLGEALRIKPMVTLIDGQVEAFAQPRTMRRAIRRVLQQMEIDTQGRPIHAAVFDADAPQAIAALRQQIAERFECVALYTTEFTPVMGAHTGPGGLGVAYYAEEEG